jgi:hypothetical protein
MIYIGEKIGHLCIFGFVFDFAYNIVSYSLV